MLFLNWCNCFVGLIRMQEFENMYFGNNTYGFELFSCLVFNYLIKWYFPTFFIEIVQINSINAVTYPKLLLQSVTILLCAILKL